MSSYESEPWRRLAWASTKKRARRWRPAWILFGGAGLGALLALCCRPANRGGDHALQRPQATKVVALDLESDVAASSAAASASMLHGTPSGASATGASSLADPASALEAEPSGPCQRIDEADEWRWGKARLEPRAEGYAYRSTLELRHGEAWSRCPDLAVPRIETLADLKEAWRRNHPRWRRSPLKSFKRKWAMSAAPRVPLWDLPSKARSVGLPHDGSIESGVHPPIARPKDYPYFIDRDLERTGFSSHALRAMIVAMQQAMDVLGEDYADMQFVILDASMLSGGKMPRVSNPNKSHSSHQSGRDVDIAIALRETSSGRFYWGHRESSKRLLNRDRTLNRFAKRMGMPSLRALARQIRTKERKRKRKRKKKKSLTALQRARIQVDNKIHRYVYDAIWQLVLHSWLPGNLRWAFLDKPQQKLLHAAGRRAGQRTIADTAIAYGGKRRRRYRKHSAVRCVYQPGSKGHDIHIHLRYNCGPHEEACSD